MRHKNPFDSKTFTSVEELEKYVIDNYYDSIPVKYRDDISKFLYDFRNPGGRKCQICGSRTQWNPKLKKYNVLCSTPGVSNGFNFVDLFKKSIHFFKHKGNSCEAVMRKIYLNNIKKTHGTDNLMDNPEYQKMLLTNRKITSVEYVEINGSKVAFSVVGSYERIFLHAWYKHPKTKHITLQMPGITLISGDQYTITDAFVPDYNIHISIKDMGDNPNYINNYKKSILFYNKYNREDQHYIELNGKDQVEKGPELIYKLIKKQLKSTDDIFKPIYYEKYK